MERSKKLYNISDKSKLIQHKSRTPAQDRLQALQDRLRNKEDSTTNKSVSKNPPLELIDPLKLDLYKINKSNDEKNLRKYQRQFSNQSLQSRLNICKIKPSFDNKNVEKTIYNSTLKLGESATNSAVSHNEHSPKNYEQNPFKYLWKSMKSKGKLMTNEQLKIKSHSFITESCTNSEQQIPDNLFEIFQPDSTNKIINCPQFTKSTNNHDDKKCLKRRNSDKNSFSILDKKSKINKEVNRFTYDISLSQISSRKSNIKYLSNSNEILSLLNSSDKLSVNNRLENLRKKLQENQQFNVLKDKKQDFAAEVKTEEMPKNLEKYTNNQSEEIENNFESYETVNSNLINLFSTNHQSSKLSKDFLYIIPDTNVFLQELTFLNDLVKSKFCGKNKSVVYIPYIVIQELDKLKTRKDCSISVRASRVINYLNEKFSKKDHHFAAESATQSRRYLIEIENADDLIINCCLHMKSIGMDYILLSNDINLRNKALFNQLFCSTKSELELTC